MFLSEISKLHENVTLIKIFLQKLMGLQNLYDVSELARKKKFERLVILVWHQNRVMKLGPDTLEIR